MTFAYKLLDILQFGGIFIPLAATFILIDKCQTKAAINLIVANIGCLIMNGVYFLMLRSSDTIISAYIQYLGDFLFYLFFIRFILYYLGLDKYKRVRRTINAWCVFEVVLLIMMWIEVLGRLTTTVVLSEGNELLAYEWSMEHGSVLYNIRYMLLMTGLSLLIINMIVKRVRIKQQGGNERHTLMRLIIASFIIIIPIILEQVLYIPFKLVPIFSSVALFLIIVSVIDGDFFITLELGRRWVVENSDNMFIIADKSYAYIDSNSLARKRFEPLRALHKGERLPHDIYLLFRGDEPEIELNGRYFQRMKKEFYKKDKTIGYCVTLIDITEHYEMMEQLKEAKEHAEQANESKSNFLSNMSHEIRTPMNAIVGMTEILLRSDLNDTDRSYLMNIKSSGNALLAIINDILDFSKIESGKLELVEDNYEPMSMLSDLSMIFLNRIGDKPIDLMFDIDTELPHMLYGDIIRIRQIIINLVNNAIKFTESGFVKLSIKVTQMSESDMVNLDVVVKDSGQGVKKEDADKLFASFSQVDTKKNRNKEGTGLGLSISKQLVEMMGGQIGLRSEYGKGSEFYFNILQKRISNEKAAELKKELTSGQPLVISGMMRDRALQEGLVKLVNAYGLTYIDCREAEERNVKVDYFFVDEEVYQKFNEHVEEYFTSHGTELCVLQNPMKGDIDNKQVTMVNKPLYTLNFCQVINHESMADFISTDEDIRFVAPDANILIVDDNEMNLKVAIGLLQPLHMQIDTADSGKKAIEMVQKKKYHIVFMDHMMPVMDGVEATQHIRELDEEYLKIMPIIALSANAVTGARESFLSAGMDDFVAKPIELNDICMKIKKWLPRDFVKKATEFVPPIVIKADELPVIEGLDVAEGIKNSGSVELFISLLGDFYKMIDMKSTKIEKCLADGLIRDYTIEVHALKNTARMIGAMELSESFYQMEQCGNAGDVEMILSATPEILERFRALKPVLEPYGKADEQNKMQVSSDEIIEVLNKLRTAMDSFDLDGADEAMGELETYRLPDTLQKQMENLRAYVADVAMEDVMNVCQEMIEALQKI